MENKHEGGCLCGEIRYQVTAKPQRLTICHCTFCQRFTGSAFLVEPIFLKTDFEIIKGDIHCYEHRSDGSQMVVTVNSCPNCCTTLFLGFERFTEVIGICGGTFDNPNWFDRDPEITKHIFTDSAQEGVVLPAGIDSFPKHGINLDGSPNIPVVHPHHLLISR